MARSRRGRPLIDLGRTFSTVLRAIEEAGIDYVVVGSSAAAAWGVVRMTRDVDVVLLIPSGDTDRLIDLLLADPSLYFPNDDARSALRSGGWFNVLEPSSGGKIDVFVATAEDGFTRSRIARRVRADVLGDAGLGGNR